MNDGKALGETGWKFHEEFVRLNPDLIDVGVGQDAAEQCGMPPRELAELLQASLHEFSNGGANAVLIKGTKLYVRRRDRHLDVGTRKDFEALDWAVICDAVDRTIPR